MKKNDETKEDSSDRLGLDSTEREILDGLINNLRKEIKISYRKTRNFEIASDASDEVSHETGER